jgi:branched-chain amino acid transport system substrate-binding protein
MAQNKAVVLLLTLAGLAAACIQPQTGNGYQALNPALRSDLPFVQNDVLSIGVVLPLSGDLAMLGLPQKAAIELAEQDVRQQLAKETPSLQLRVIYEDTESRVDHVLDIIKRLYGQGIRIFVGPSDSNSVEAALTYANNRGLILVSPSSTVLFNASHRSNLYRLVPNDLAQAAVLVNDMVAQGKRDIFGLIRGDRYGDGLQNGVFGAAKSRSTIAYAYSTQYDPAAKDFSAQLADISYELNKVANGRLGDVALQVTAQAEIADLFKAASHIPMLGSVKWYGSDTNAKDPGLVHDKDAAAFAVATHFMATAFDVGDGDEADYETFIERVKTKKNISDTTIYTALAYDAFLFAALVSASVGTQNDESAWKAAAADLGPRLKGVSGGNLALDKYGDRAASTWAFWGVRQKPDGTYEWYLDHKIDLHTLP